MTDKLSAEIEAAAEVKLHETMDADVWAREFIRLNNSSDLDMMRSWFANAIMCGWDHSRWKIERQLSERDAALDTARKALMHIATQGCANGHDATSLCVPPCERCVAWRAYLDTGKQSRSE